MSIDNAAALGSGWKVIRTDCGNASDLPMPADYDGDHRADFSSQRTSMWFVVALQSSPVRRSSRQ